MLPTVHYSIDVIREEAKQLINQGKLNRQQPIYTLCCHFPPCEWNGIEQALEFNDYLLRDRIVDLLGCECWAED
jgi:hypothetical protein